jgi:hypothetical protein
MWAGFMSAHHNELSLKLYVLGVLAGAAANVFGDFEGG